jgi:hypothetical protein
MTEQQLQDCFRNNITLMDDEVGRECDILSFEHLDLGLCTRVFYLDTFEEELIPASNLVPLS